VGGLVACNLAGVGIAQRLLARTPRNAPELAGAQAVQCEFEDSEQSRAALAGVEVLFVGDDNVLRGPAGDGRVAAVTRGRRCCSGG